MSSEAITRNDLTAILNEVLPPTPSEYRKLLWTNQSPTSSFTAQTVSLDLSDYDAVEIYAKRLISVDGFIETRVSVGTVGAICGIYGSNGLYRSATVSTTGIVFASCYTDGVANNDYLAPVYIYGIKYERVNPPQVEIADVVIEQGSNSYGSYRKWESGTMEQWGLEASASASNHTVTFPIPFVSTTYIVLGTNTSGTQSSFMTSNTNASYFYVYPSASTKLYWFAIGKWK